MNSNRIKFFRVRIILIVSIWLSASPSWSRPQFVRLVPTTFECGTCHDDPQMRQFRNGFGIDFASQRTVWFSDNNDADCPQDCTVAECPADCVGICPLDSDGDGLSNGIELGDPDCQWRPGDRLPNGGTSHPGEPRDPDRCGNGEINAGEECDGEAMEVADCSDLGFLPGPLSCHPNCTFDDSGCEPIPEPDAEIVDAEIVDAEIVDAEIVDADFVRDGGVFDEGPPDSHSSDAVILAEDAEQEEPDELDSGTEDAHVETGDQTMGPGLADSNQAVSQKEGGCAIGLVPGAIPWPLAMFGVLCISLTRRRD